MIKEKYPEAIQPVIEARLTGNESGQILVGTVQGDIHDIGKNLVSMMMEGAGFEVIDIGINNPVENYLAASTDLVELERRQQMLARKGIY